MSTSSPSFVSLLPSGVTAAGGGDGDIDDHERSLLELLQRRMHRYPLMALAPTSLHTHTRSSLHTHNVKTRLKCGRGRTCVGACGEGPLGTELRGGTNYSPSSSCADGKKAQRALCDGVQPDDVAARTHTLIRAQRPSLCAEKDDGGVTTQGCVNTNHIGRNGEACAPRSTTHAESKNGCARVCECVSTRQPPFGAEMPAFVGPVIKSRAERPCHQYIEVSPLLRSCKPNASATNNNNNTGNYNNHSLTTGGQNIAPVTASSSSNNPSTTGLSLGAIAFRNHFVAYVSIEQQQHTHTSGHISLATPTHPQPLPSSSTSASSSSTSPPPPSHTPLTSSSSHTPVTSSSPSSPWVVVLERLDLMPNPHYEKGAQDMVVVPVSWFNESYDGQRDDMPLRIHLYQPSAMWRKVEIRDIKCHALPPTAPRPELSTPDCRTIEATLGEHEYQQKMST